MEIPQNNMTHLVNTTSKLPTLLRLFRVWRPAVLAGVAGPGHRLLGLVCGLLPLPGLLAGDGRGGRQGQLRRLRGTQRAQVLPAQAGGQGQRVLQISWDYCGALVCGVVL